MTTSTADGSLRLNGFTLDEGIRKLVDAYLAHEAKGDTAVDKDHPVVDRQTRLTNTTEGIEKIVKDALGTASRFNPHNPEDVGKADALIKNLAYEFAKTRKYSGSLNDFTSEDVLRYLAEAGNATGDQTVGNMIEFKKNILNMPSLRAGHPLYNRESPIAHLIQYIASQKDDESRSTQHVQALLQQHATDPRYILATQGGLGHATGKHYSPSATIPEMLGDLRQAGELEAQKWAANKSKTYTAPAAPSHH